MFDHDAFVFNDGNACLLGNMGSFCAADAELHPEEARPLVHGRRFPCVLRAKFGSAEYIHDVHPFLDVSKRRVGFQPPDVLPYRVDRNDSISRSDQIASNFINSLVYTGSATIFLERPISLVLVILSILFIVWPWVGPMLKKVFKKDKTAA